MSLREHYDRHILPHLIDMAMRAPLASRERADLLQRRDHDGVSEGDGHRLVEALPIVGGRIAALRLRRERDPRA